MTTDSHAYADWRTGPNRRRCLACDASIGACEGSLMFSRRRCCDDCDHDERPTR